MVRYSKLYSVLLGILSFLLMSSFSSWAWEELLERADTDLKAKNYLKAKENYRQVYLTEKKGSLADRGMFGMAKADYLLKNYSEATLNLKRYLSSAATEQRNEAHLMLGYIYMFDRKYTDAARAFEQVGGDFAEKAMIGRAEIALLSGKTSEAERLLERVGKGQFDGSPRAQYIQALLFARKGRGGDALADIDRLSPQALKDEDLRVEKAEIYTACGKAKEAEVMLKGIVSAPMGISEQVRARRALMRAYEVQGKRDEMLALGLELLPYDTNDEVRRKIIAMYDQKGDFENVLKQTAQLRDKALKSIEIERRLKKILSAKPENMLQLIQNYAIYLNSESPVLAEAAELLISSGKKLEGRSLLLKAVKGSSAGEASLALAGMYVDEGKLDDAKALLQPLAAGKKHSSAAMALLGEIAEKKGDAKAAISLYAQAVKGGKSPRIEARLGDLYWKNGDRSAALKHFGAAADSGDADAMLKVADVYYLSGQKQKAERYYKKAIDADIKDSKLLQWAFYQYGKLAKNSEYLQKAAAAGGELGDAAQVYLSR